MKNIFSKMLRHLNESMVVKVYTLSLFRVFVHSSLRASDELLKKTSSIMQLSKERDHIRKSLSYSLNNNSAAVSLSSSGQSVSK